MEKHSLYDFYLNDEKICSNIISIPPGTHKFSVIKIKQYSLKQDLSLIVSFYFNLIDSSKAPLFNDILNKYFSKKYDVIFISNEHLNINISTIDVNFESFDHILRGNSTIVSKNSSIVCSQVYVKKLAIKFLTPLLIIFGLLVLPLFFFSVAILLKGFYYESIVGMLLSIILLFLFKYLLYNSPPLYSIVKAVYQDET